MKKSNFIKNGDENYIKISMLGDLMCGNVLLNASSISNDNVHFDLVHIFFSIKDYFFKADYYVANFETVFGGNSSWIAIYSIYNTPDQFAIDIKNVGIDIFLTANNHIWDKGYEGAKQTTEHLRFLGFDVVRTFDKRQLFRIALFNIKICFLAYTESIKFITSEDNLNCVISNLVKMISSLYSKQEFRKRDIRKEIEKDVEKICHRV